MLDNFVTFEGSPNGSRGGKAIGVTLGPNLPDRPPDAGADGGGTRDGGGARVRRGGPEDRHSAVRAGEKERVPRRPALRRAPTAWSTPGRS